MKFLKKVFSNTIYKEMSYPELIKEHEKLVKDLQEIEDLTSKELKKQSNIKKNLKKNQNCKTNLNWC